jgi:hypothetical protein
MPDQRDELFWSEEDSVRDILFEFFSRSLRKEAMSTVTHSNELVPVKRSKVTKDLDSLVLPLVPHEISNDLDDYHVLISGEMGIGKGLALDTPIPTKQGWKLMKNVMVGDELFDEKGDTCVVTFVSAINKRPCFRVTFDDGTEIVTDDQHRWKTWTKAARRSLSRRRTWKLHPKGTDQRHKRIDPPIMSTPEMMETLFDGECLNHSIPLAPAVSMYPRTYPIRPYMLGVWLGNGDSASATITNGCGWIRKEIESLGFLTSDRVSRPTEFRCGVRHHNGTPLTTTLRKLNLLGNKHIPQEYLNGSEFQRLDLLQGLMDTDGCCSKNSNRCEITFCTRQLALDTHRLIESLGIKAFWDERPAKINGVVKGIAYRTGFTTAKRVFRMPRKLSLLPRRVRPTVNTRYITKIESVASVPTRCLQVDSPSHLFLASYACVPTHNTTLAMVSPDVFLISFDPFHDSLRVIEEYCPGTKKGFQKFLKLLDLMEAAGKKKFPYKRVVVDGVDLWFRACMRHVCAEAGVEHPADGAYGKVWDALKSEFISAVDRVMALPCGTWFVCHAKDKEIEKRDGTKVEKLRPVLTSAAEEILVGKVNGLFNIHYIGEERVCRIRGSEDISAKCNIDGHFQTPSGKQIVDIVLGDEGPTEAYNRIVNAFENKQTYTSYEQYTTRMEKKGGTEPDSTPPMKKSFLKKKAK